MSDMLPHIRGQGIMDLEFEGDGEFTQPAAEVVSINK